MMQWNVLECEADVLGESPFWHPQEQCLYWVDIPGQRIRRMDPGSKAAESWDMPSEPGCIAPATKGGLVIALRDGIYRANAWGGALRLLHRFDYDPVTTRFNDGKADCLGRFWAGTLVQPRTSPDAALYALDCRSPGAPVVQRMAGNAMLANGLGWSPDNRTVYWSDTPSHHIRAWDWDAAGNTMATERVFHQFEPKPAGWHSGMPGYGGRPDGAAVDAQGNYYAAMFEGQRLCKLAPDGTVLESIRLPAMCPTMPCFGGADLCTLYVTTALEKRPHEEMARFPQSGHVFWTRVEVPGLPVNFFVD